MTGTAAVARASRRALVNHLIRAVGSRRRLAGLLVASVAVTAALEVGAYELFREFLVVPPSPTAPPEVQRAWSTLLIAEALSSASLGLLVTMFVPAGRPIAVAARLAGGRPGQIAIGEALPLLLGIAAVVIVGGAGPIWFVAQGQDRAVVTALGLTGLGLVAATAVVTTLFVVGAVARRLGTPFTTARFVGFFAASLVLAGAFAELLGSAVRGVPSVQAEAVSALLWVGRPLPDTFFALLPTAMLLSLLSILLVVGVAHLTPRSTLGVPARGPVHRRAADLCSPVTAIEREALLAVRHPTVQLALVAAVLLGALVVTAARAALIAPGLAAEGLALLLCTGAELAVGRTRSWQWLQAPAGVRQQRLWLCRAVGSCVPGVILFSTAVAVIGGGPTAVAALVLPGLAFFVVTAALAFLAGTILPFDEQAPAAMLLTSTVVLALDAAYLLLRSRVASDGSALAAAMDLATAVLVVALSTSLLRRRAEARCLG